MENRDSPIVNLAQLAKDSRDSRGRRAEGSVFT